MPVLRTRPPVDVTKTEREPAIPLEAAEPVAPGALVNVETELPYTFLPASLSIFDAGAWIIETIDVGRTRQILQPIPARLLNENPPVKFDTARPRERIAIGARNVSKVARRFACDLHGYRYEDPGDGGPPRTIVVGNPPRNW